MSDILHIPGADKLLKADFCEHEIETVYDLMSCMQGPPSNSGFRRILMLMLRGHYSSSANYPEDLSHLGCYTWAPGEGAAAGTLVVDFTHVFNDKKPDQVPGIFVGFGGMQLRKLALGDHHSHSADRATEHVVREGKLTVRIHHITKSIADSYDLAEMSSVFLMAMARVIRNAAGATAFEVTGYGEATKNKLTNLVTNYEVVLPVEISYTPGVALSEESHRIRAISGVIGSYT